MVFMFGAKLFLRSYHLYMLSRKKQLLESYLSQNLNPTRSLFSNLLIYLTSMILLNCKYFPLFFISGHVNCYLVWMSILNLLLSSVHPYATRQSCSGKLYVMLCRYHPIWLAVPKICWFSFLEFLANKYKTIKLFCKILKNSMLIFFFVIFVYLHNTCYSYKFYN